MASARPEGTTRLAYGERRAELVRAAIRVVADRGVAGLSHRAVAAEAGVTHGLVRHHFGSMTALIAESLDTVLPESLVVNPVTLLLDGVHFPEHDLVAWIDDQEDLQVFEYEVLLATRHMPELRPLALRMYEGYEASVRAAFVERGMPEPPQESVSLIVAAIEGLVLHRVTFRREDGSMLAGAFAALRAAILATVVGPR